MIGSAQIADGLSPEHRRLLELLLEKEGLRSDSVLGAGDRDADRVPLSTSQERIWMLRHDGSESADNVPVAFAVTGTLDVPTLARGLDELVRRHEALRARVEVAGGRVALLISRAFSVPVPGVDLRDLPAAERWPQCRHRLQDEAWRPFDVETAPLLRAMVWHLDADEHVVLLVFHRLIVDGWALRLLLTELGALHDALKAGTPLPAPPKAVSFAEFARRERQRLPPERIDEAVRFWRTQLAGVPAGLDLPTDRPRHTGGPLRGGAYRFALPADKAEALTVLGQESGVTLFMTLLAAFQVVLHRWTGQATVVVGTTVSVRDRAEVEALVGNCSNLLLLRADFDDRPSFRRLLARVGRTAAESLAHQDVPIQAVVDALAADAVKVPAVRATCLLREGGLEQHLVLAGLRLQPLPLDPPTVGPDVALDITDTRDGLQAVIEYRADLFEVERIGRMAEDLRTVLDAALADPDRAAADLCQASRPLAPAESPGGRSAGEVVPARSPLERQLIELWESILGVHPVGIRDSFFELGGHSLLALGLLSRVEEITGVRVELSALLDTPTVERLAVALERDGRRRDGSSLVPLQPRGTRRPLFLVSPGAVIFMARLGAYLASDQPLYGLQPPGLEPDQTPLDRVEAVAALHVEAIRRVQPKGPYLLGGRCFGAVVAFEMARCLRAAGERVDALIVLDSSPPRRSPGAKARPAAGEPRPSLLGRAGRLGSRGVVRRVAREVRRWVRRLLLDPVKRAVRRRFGSLHVRRMQRLEDANIRALRSYAAEPHPGRITLIRSAKYATLRRKNRHLGWAELAAGGFDCHVVPGRHATVFQEPYVQDLARCIQACLDATLPVSANRASGADPAVGRDGAPR